MTVVRAVALLPLIVLLASRCSAARFYVSPSGSDPAPGTRSRPLRSLESAIAKARAAGAGSEIVLTDGIHLRDKPLILDEADSHLTVRSEHAGKARLVGGRVIHGFHRLTDPEIIQRIDPAARAHVVVCDLKAQGITDYGEMTSRGFGRNITPAGLELFFNGQPMELARWPNRGWAFIAGVPDGTQGDSFNYSGDRPERWTHAADAWLHGYWTYDWADSYEKIGSIDTAKKVITTRAPHGVYGYTQGKRYYALNILEELDAPREWYLDRSDGRLYFWPPAPIERGEAIISIISEPLIVMRKTQGVKIIGLTIEAGRGCGVEIQGGSGNVIDGCLLRNLGTVGVSVGGMIGDIFGRIYGDTTFNGDGGTNNGVRACEITQTGEGGVILGGGDRRTLKPAHNFVENCRIHHYQRWARTYRPAVAPHGVGQIIRHNLIYDAPHSAILANGNDHLVEYNEIHDVCRETGDAGAFYMGRDWTQRGNTVRYNYFHDLKGVQGQKGFTDVMAVYLDDWASGTRVYGNVFERAGRAVMIGGGRDNTVVNNIFIDCPLSVHVDARGIGWAKRYFDGGDTTLFDRLDAVDYRHPPYSTRYPRLVRILEDEPAIPKGNRIELNVVQGSEFILWQNGMSDKVVRVQKNYIEGDPDFRAPDPKTFQLPQGAPALAAGFQQIPFARIGLEKRRR